MISLCLSVCAPFCLYNSKSITSIELKFGGQVFHGVQTDSSKFGVICSKIKVRRGGEIPQCIFNDFGFLLDISSKVMNIF